MKKLVYAFVALVTAVFILSGMTLQAQTPTPIKTWGFESSWENWAAGNEATAPTLYMDDITISRVVVPAFVSQWGKTVQGTAWPILNNATTPAGNAGIGNGATPTGWATICGGFDQTVEATTDQAVIVSGQMELMGSSAGSAYTHLRYALTFIDSTTLKSQNTDSALWVNNGKLKHYGYEFCPRTGTGTMATGTWGVGTVGVVKNGDWNSTYSNGGMAISAVEQAPRNAEMVAGVYNWAISVQPLANGTNEIRWYLVEQNNKYWIGGTAIDSSKVTTKFNGICFGFNSDGSATNVNFMAVKVELCKSIDFYLCVERCDITQNPKTQAAGAESILTIKLNVCNESADTLHDVTLQLYPDDILVCGDTTKYFTSINVQNNRDPEYAYYGDIGPDFCACPQPYQCGCTEFQFNVSGLSQTQICCLHFIVYCYLVDGGIFVDPSVNCNLKVEIQQNYTPIRIPVCQHVLISASKKQISKANVALAYAAGIATGFFIWFLWDKYK